MPPSAASSAVSVPSGRIGEAVIPDCCNLGVVFRTLLGVNATALTVILVYSSNWQLDLIEFIEASMVIELSCLWSLFALCLLRRLVQRRPAALPAWLQRGACAIVPALVTGMIVQMFTSVDWLRSSFVHMTTLKGAVSAAILGALFQHYFELRTRAFSPALVEARLQALQARIRPHFLFNSLNAVLSLIRTEPRRAESTLEDLADLFRVLMSDPRNMTTLDEEIRLCKQYLSIEQIRLGDRLQVQWDLENLGDETLRRAQMPVLLLQPLLENAVHYGVEPAVGPMPVQVRLARSLERIEIAVVNPYHGDAVAKGNHMALANIRERLELLYDVEAQLSTAITQGQFEVKLRFPYIKVHA